MKMLGVNVYCMSAVCEKNYSEFGFVYTILSNSLNYFTRTYYIHSI